MQRALYPFDMRIVTVAVSTANFINKTTGLRDSITLRHKDYYTNKCFLFAILEAFNRYSEQLRPLCPTLPDTVPKIIDHFTSTANDDTFLTNLAHLLINENVLMSLWDFDNHPGLKNWAESADDGYKQQRLIDLAKGLFRDALDNYKRKDTKATEVTILLFAHSYNLRINVIPTRATPALAFNQFNPPNSKDKTIELINWDYVHFDLLVRTKIPAEAMADHDMTPSSLPSVTIASTLSNPLPLPVLFSLPLGTVPFESTTVSAQPKLPLTTFTNDTSTIDHFNCPTIVTSCTSNNCLASPDDYHPTATNQSTATESTHKNVSHPLPEANQSTIQTFPTTLKNPKLPCHLIKRLGPHRICNEGSLPPSTANGSNTPTLSGKKVKNVSEYFKARELNRGHQEKGFNTTRKKLLHSSLPHHTPTYRISQSPPTQHSTTGLPTSTRRNELPYNNHMEQQPHFPPQQCYQTDPANYPNKQQFHNYWSEKPINQQHLPLHNHHLYSLPPNQQHSLLLYPPWSQHLQQPIYGYTNNFPRYIEQSFPGVYNPQFFQQWTPQFPPQHSFTPPFSQTKEIVTQTVSALLRSGKLNPYANPEEKYNKPYPQNAFD